MSKAKELLIRQGWVELKGFESYITNGKDVISYTKYPSGVMLTWAKATNADQLNIRSGDKRRSLTRSALVKAYQNGGELPPSRTKTCNHARKGVSKYKYYSGTTPCTIQDIVKETALTYDTVRGRLQLYGHFDHCGVKYTRV